MLLHVTLDSLHVKFCCHLVVRCSIACLLWSERLTASVLLVAGVQRTCTIVHISAKMAQQHCSWAQVPAAALEQNLNKFCLCRQGIMGLG